MNRECLSICPSIKMIIYLSFYNSLFISWLALRPTQQNCNPNSESTSALELIINMHGVNIKDKNISLIVRQMNCYYKQFYLISVFELNFKLTALIVQGKLLPCSVELFSSSMTQDCS